MTEAVSEVRARELEEPAPYGPSTRAGFAPATVTV